jgi:hypothetical protein
VRVDSNLDAVGDLDEGNAAVHGILLAVTDQISAFELAGPMTTGQPKRNWKERLLEELRNLSITVIYLWVLFSVFALHWAIILADFHISAPARLV